jgi:hypothetical protein
MKRITRQKAYELNDSTGAHAGGCQTQWRGLDQVMKLEALNVD